MEEGYIADFAMGKFFAIFKMVTEEGKTLEEQLVAGGFKDHNEALEQIRIDDNKYGEGDYFIRPYFSKNERRRGRG